ncbi:hypothetical protein FA15DRAFT_343800 [Coprinopsis marcescibilis]|uniref:Uncharacterized protein n=1 Tax=Coprinopsis marcescibilis TaxID=230819 RepID=A0A5C3L8V1_COPMA|nr:hypothetical protein FA15DRAFT_343800 [Coprinopsis marcescibilis]
MSYHIPRQRRTTRTRHDRRPTTFFTLRFDALTTPVFCLIFFFFGLKKEKKTMIAFVCYLGLTDRGLRFLVDTHTFTLHSLFDFFKLWFCVMFYRLLFASPYDPAYCRCSDG